MGFLDPEVMMFVLSIISAVLGWIAKTLYYAVRELQRDLAKLREDLPLNYVRQDDFKEFRHTVMNTLTRIESLLYKALYQPGAPVDGGK